MIRTGEEEKLPRFWVSIIGAIFVKDLKSRNGSLQKLRRRGASGSESGGVELEIWRR